MGFLRKPPGEEDVEKLARSRTRMLRLFPILYIGQQGVFIDAAQRSGRLTFVHAVAWLAMTLVMLALLLGKGFPTHSAETRAQLDDETTRAHRFQAMSWGFVSAIVTSMIFYASTFYETIPAHMVAHGVVSAAILVAVLRFAILEKRAEPADDE